MPPPITYPVFREQCSTKHRDNIDYSLVVWKGDREKVELKCNKCELVFWQQARQHRRGQGCPACAKKISASHKRIGREKIQNHILTSFSNIVEMKPLQEDVTLADSCEYLCEYHGWQKQRIESLMRGHGCYKCGRESANVKTIKALNNPSNKERFMGHVNGRLFKERPEKKDIPATLYLIKLIYNDGTEYLKIGLTTNERYSTRLAGIKCDSKCERIEHINIYRSTLYDVWQNEQRMLKKYRKWKANINPRFKGSSECLSPSIEHRLFFEISDLNIVKSTRSN